MEEINQHKPAFDENKILIVGAGNMGGTYARSLVASQIVSINDLQILERQPALCSNLMEAGYEHVHAQPGDYISNVGWIILAVKPQDCHKLFEHLRPYVHEDQFVLTIMAGINIATIQKELGLKKVVRAMPNLPAGIGMGMTAFTISQEVGKFGLLAAQNLLHSTGKSLYLEDEEKINAATAISGSGPAFVFYYMDSMIESALKLGFTPSQAKLLVEQTFWGSVNLLNRNGSTPKEWIQRVSSKGGTTEAAMRVYEENKLKEAADKGIKAAFNRAVELSKQ